MIELRANLEIIFIGLPNLVEIVNLLAKRRDYFVSAKGICGPLQDRMKEKTVRKALRALEKDYGYVETIEIYIPHHKGRPTKYYKLNQKFWNQIGRQERFPRIAAKLTSTPAHMILDDYNRLMQDHP